MNSVSGFFETEADMHQWLVSNAESFNTGAVLYMRGNLGAGKTSFCRALIQALGYEGRVKSPTYTLLEVYDLAQRTVCHFDLYRMADPEELFFIGADDYNQQDALWLVEWPEKGEGALPAADVIVELRHPEQNSDGSVGKGRQFSITACTNRGESLVKNLHGL